MNKSEVIELIREYQLVDDAFGVSIEYPIVIWYEPMFFSGESVRPWTDIGKEDSLEDSILEDGQVKKIELNFIRDNKYKLQLFVSK